MNGHNIKLIEKALNGTANTEEIKQLLMLMDNISFDDWMEKEWTDTGNHIDNRIERKMLAEIKRKKTKTKKLNFQRVFNVAACIAIFALSGIAFYLYRNKTSEIIITEKEVIADAKVSAERGQKANIILPDGTKVWINSDSELKYGSNFNSKERNVYLSGQAFFEVAENKEAPFIVNTPYMAVKALGTSFDVKAYPEELLQTMVLVEGKAEVSTESDKLILSPNQRIDFNVDNLSLYKTESIEGEDFSLWRKDIFYFHDQPLQDIVKILSRQYNIEFVFNDESVKKYKFSGTVANTSLTSILQIFSLTSPLRYEIKDTAIYLKEDKKAARYFNKIIN